MSRVWIKYCEFCKHLDSELATDTIFRLMKCKAFPERIPSEIQNGKVDHRLPYEGDNGIQFELQTEISEIPISKLHPELNVTIEDIERLLGYSFYYSDFNQDK